MSEMIEKIARAICDAGREDDPQFDLMSAQVKESYRHEARAAIEAMREPSKAMVEAGDTALENVTDSDWDSGADGNGHNSHEWIISGAQTEIYQAMIDSALSE